MPFGECDLEMELAEERPEAFIQWSPSQGSEGGIAGGPAPGDDVPLFIGLYGVVLYTPGC